jgi:hypothetical protein
MKNIGGAACLISAMLLSACSGGEQPRAADFVAAAPAHTDLGDLRVHHNALPTLSLNAPVAQQYQVTRDAGTALVVIALRRLVGGEERAAEGEVRAVAVDLQGARQDIVFRRAQTGDYSDHIGTLRIVERDTYRFEVTVESEGRTEMVSFQRNF